MQSTNKLYKELLKEHPELKNSQENIQEIILSLQKINPNILIDEDFKLHLRQRLNTIAKYNPSKHTWYFSRLKYFIPVFTFWFAIFGFLYFSQDFEQPLQQEIWWFETQMFMSDSDDEKNIQSNQNEGIIQMSDIKSLEMLDKSNETLESSNATIEWSSISIQENSITQDTENSDGAVQSNMVELMIQKTEPTGLKVDEHVSDTQSLPDKTTDDFSDELWDEIESMLFSFPTSESDDDKGAWLWEDWTDQIVEEIFQDLSDSIEEESVSESIEIGSSAMKMMISDEEIDQFKNRCLDSNWLIKDLPERERICILENTSCLESDYNQEECVIEK